MLDEIATDKLKQIFTDESQAKSVLKAEGSGEIAEEEFDSYVLNFREHAFGEYWQRKNLSKCLSLNDDDIKDILSKEELSVRFSILGEAARLGLINELQCEELLKLVPEEEWAYSQINARRTIFLIKDASSFYDVDEVINEFLKSKGIAWAILELLSFLTMEALGHLQGKMNDKQYLTRHDRHMVREAISKLLKNNRDKSLGTG